MAKHTRGPAIDLKTHVHMTAGAGMRTGVHTATETRMETGLNTRDIPITATTNSLASKLATKRCNHFGLATEPAQRFCTTECEPNGVQSRFTPKCTDERDAIHWKEGFSQFRPCQVQLRR